MKALVALKDGFQYRLGDGNSSFWYTNWSGIGNLVNQVPYVNIHDLQMRVRDVYIDGKWNFNLLYTTIPVDVMDHLKLFPVCLNSQAVDRYTWKGNLSGLYTTKDALHNVLPTKTMLSHRGLFLVNFSPRTNTENLAQLLRMSFLKCNISPTATIVRWNAHGGIGMILNVDGSSIGNPGISGFGGLIQNFDRTWVHGFAGNIGFSNILHAELLAMYHGLVLAWKLNIKDMWCYSDSKTAIKLLSDHVNEWHHYAAIIYNIKDLLTKN
ncbi:hypothetical protein TSUD_84190 [Trifolium subterraneum]|uniref:RNase H type-1 domain-containing protein n=1 Tax=Trifolium subterraneum TaxID=3900 RepID=A0A2Z6LWT6_TRISU|nr:hypothetical protein TSUD_84190 [Trifolium subterraneum]